MNSIPGDFPWPCSWIPGQARDDEAGTPGVTKLKQNGHRRAFCALLPSRGREAGPRGNEMLNLFQALMPKESRFFDLFARHAETMVGGAGVMSRMFAERQGIQEACRQISEYETKADEVTREVLHAVRRTFITPFDRSAITDLISSMDDAIDEMQKTAKAITQFEVTSFEPQMCEMAQLAEKAARLVAE